MHLHEDFYCSRQRVCQIYATPSVDGAVKPVIVIYSIYTVYIERERGRENIVSLSWECFLSYAFAVFVLCMTATDYNYLY